MVDGPDRETRSGNKYCMHSCIDLQEAARLFLLDFGRKARGPLVSECNFIFTF